MTKAHQLLPRKEPSTNTAKADAVPLNFLLGCNDGELGNYELARLADVADLRKRMQVLLDQIVDQMGLAWLAAWFRNMDRGALIHAIENEEDPLAWARRMIKEGQRSKQENESIPLPPLPPGAAHLAAALRYQERNIAAGLCAVCPEPQDPNSVRFCTKHLAIARARKSQKKTLDSDPGSREYLYAGELPESTHGRQPGTLAMLAMSREKRTRAALAEMGIPPESAAVSLRAAKEALLKCMSDSRVDAMTQEELLTKALISSKSTLKNALKELLSAGRIERIGKGVQRNPYQYFLAVKS